MRISNESADSYFVKYPKSNLRKRGEDLPKEWRYVSSRPKELIIDDPSHGIRTRSNLRDTCNYLTFVSQIESKNFEEAEKDNNWLMAMQEELNQFERNKV